MKLTLVILAAGKSSRYGALKQFEKIGKQNVCLLEYGIYDAIKVGFSKVVFVLGEDYKKHIFELSKKIRNKITVEYIFQSLDNTIPKNYLAPKKRRKPWGTAHAILCCQHVIKEPFAVINADDFYGYNSYKILYENLIKEKNCNFMVGFELKKTLSENGNVNRGICTLNNRNYLKTIKEEIGIKNLINHNRNTIVSMNMWGFKSNFIEYLEEEFDNFLKKNINTLDKEFLLTLVVDNLIKSGREQVKVLKTKEEWIGITFQADKEKAELKLNKKKYPRNLWKVS